MRTLSHRFLGTTLSLLMLWQGVYGALWHVAHTVHDDLGFQIAICSKDGTIFLPDADPDPTNADISFEAVLNAASAIPDIHGVLQSRNIDYSSFVYVERPHAFFISKVSLKPFSHAPPLSV